MANETLQVSWDEVVAAERGHIWLDRHEDGFRFLIMRGGASVCAYLGVPESHPLAGHNYEKLPIECHGGLTYGDLGDGKHFPAGWYWYGWDYAHCGDFCVYDDKYGLIRGDDKKWTPEMVNADSWTARYEFKDLMDLTETVMNKREAKHVG